MIKSKISNDPDVECLLLLVIAILGEVFSLGEDEAWNLTERFYKKSKDEGYCRDNNIVLAEDDDFFQRRPESLALAVYYREYLNKSPNFEEFSEWERDFYKSSGRL